MMEELQSEYVARIKKTQLEASRRGFHALIILGLAPRRVGDLLYLSGHQPLLPGHPRRYTFKGRGYSAIVLPIDQEPVLITSTPFVEKDLYIKDVHPCNNLLEGISNALHQYGLSKGDIGIVGMDILAAALFDDLCKELYQAKFYHADDIVMNLRAVKSPYEIAMHSTGAKIADEVGQLLRTYLRPGLTEREVYNFITQELSKRGVTGAFATCQSGARSEMPYDLEPASNKVIEDGDMVHMEINGKYSGYMIDVCRSTVVGKATQLQIDLLNLAVEMLETVVAGTRPGITAESLELISGKIARRQGLGSHHTLAYGGPATYLGHAIGLGVDEPPCLAAGDKTILVPGMVLTIEPGLYLTGYGGCRVEDEVLVTEHGVEVLNKCDRVWW